MEGKPEEISRKLRVPVDKKVVALVEGKFNCNWEGFAKCTFKNGYTHVVAYLEVEEVDEFVRFLSSKGALQIKVEDLSLEDVFLLVFGRFGKVEKF